MTNNPTLSRFPAWEPGSFHTLGPAARRHAGRPNRRILSAFTEGGVEYTLHATKGVRRRARPGDGVILAGIMANPYQPTKAPRYAETVDRAAYMRGGNFKRGSV
jgi:hypothetical protein